MSAVETKYVITDYAMPICFCSHFHKSMAIHGNITSAGFFKIINGRIETYGYSHGLKMGPDPNDAHVLETFFGLR